MPHWWGVLRCLISHCVVALRLTSPLFRFTFSCCFCMLDVPAKLCCVAVVLLAQKCKPGARPDSKAANNVMGPTLTTSS